MNKRSVLFIFITAILVLSACDYTTATPVFDIYGSPSPLYYGGLCSTPVLKMLVSGPGAGLRIDSVIAAYQLFDGSGKKVSSNTASLSPIPDTPSGTYDAERIIVIPTGGSSPDSLVYDFGNGRVDFAATVSAKFTSPSPTGYASTFYFTSTKSIPVLPCSSLKPTPAPTIDPGLPSISGPVLPPGSVDKPKPGGGGGAPPPPSCSTDPNNPSCVP
jgi:hypothetical protein